ncbi:hypothetical protein HK098_007596, partial [Nowakowskiella sp. JEL0407]
IQLESKESQNDKKLKQTVVRDVQVELNAISRSTGQPLVILDELKHEKDQLKKEYEVKLLERTLEYQRQIEQLQNEKQNELNQLHKTIINLQAAKRIIHHQLIAKIYHEQTAATISEIHMGLKDADFEHEIVDKGDVGIKTEIIRPIS